MTLPAGFARTADAPAPLPLHVVDRGGFAAWRDAQPPAVQAWLAAQRFDGSAGTTVSWANADGGLGGAVLVVGPVGRLGSRREEGEGESEDQAHAGGAIRGMT